MAVQPSEHYYTASPSSPSRRQEFDVELRGRQFHFVTDTGVFSHGRVDRGTRLLIEAMQARPDDCILDLGCGWGAVGVAAATITGGPVYLVDPNTRAVELALENIRLNRVERTARALLGPGYQPVEGIRFDLILTNPPIRAGWGEVFALIDQAPAHLKLEGRFLLVARTRQGALTLAERIRQAFGAVRELEKGGGYRVFEGWVDSQPNSGRE